MRMSTEVVDVEGRRSRIWGQYRTEAVARVRQGVNKTRQDLVMGLY